jgi:transcriptional regulator with XRE-family HTH domain
MTTVRAGQTPGELLRFWRRRRGRSQLDLAAATGVSSKHLSFVETGRSRPSRQLLVHLADALALPLKERDRLLLIAGFAPAHRVDARLDRAMQPVRGALEVLLAAHEPYPALVLNAHWELVAANRAAELLWQGVAAELLVPPVNLVRLFCHPDGVPRNSTVTPLCGRALVDRVRHRAHQEADSVLLDLATEAEGYLAQTAGRTAAPKWNGDGVLAAFGLQTRLGEVRLHTVVATLGAPLDVGPSDLALETFLPADPQSADRLRALAAAPPDRATPTTPPRTG